MSRISEYSSPAKGVGCRGCGKRQGVRYYEFCSTGDAVGCVPSEIPLCKVCVAQQRVEAEQLRKKAEGGKAEFLF